MSIDFSPSAPKLTLVGAGPGDPSLITVKGLEAIKSARVILYDALSKGSVNYLNLAKEILQKNNMTRIRQEERILE